MRRKTSTKYHYLRNLSLERKRNRSKEKKRYNNIQKNIRRTSTYKDAHPERSTTKVQNIKIEAGSTLSLFDDPENVIRITKTLDSHKTDNRTFKNIQIDLSNINSIEIGGISYLLAKVNEMAQIGRIRIWGLFNTPLPQTTYLQS